MGLATSVANLFRPVTPVTMAPGQQGQQQQSQGQQGQQQPGPSGTPPGPGGNPGGGGNPNDPSQMGGGPGGNKTANSPLDDLAKLWETDPTAKTPTDPWSQPLLQSDPSKMAQAIQGINFLDGIPGADMEAALGGDMKALIKVINAVGQRSLQTSLQISQAGVEKAGTNIRDRIDAGLGDKFKQFSLDNMPVDNPVLNHKGAQPVLRMLMQQIKSQDPSLNAQQIQEKAVTLLKGLSGAVAGSEQDGSDDVVLPGQQPKDTTDWDALFLPQGS